MQKKIIKIKTTGRICHPNCGYMPAFFIEKCKLFNKKIERVPNANANLYLYYRCKLCLNATNELDLKK